MASRRTLLLLALSLLVGAALVLGRHGVDLGDLAHNGEPLVDALVFSDWPSGHQLLAAGIVLVVVLAALVVVPAVLLVTLLLVALVVAVVVVAAVGLPLLLVVAVCALLLAPVWLLGWLLWGLVG